MTKNPLLARFAGEPALVEPTLTERFEACLIQAASHEHSAAMMAESAADSNFWPDPQSWKALYRPYVVADGILQIPVKGVLLNNFPWQDGGWATGYEYIWQAFKRGCEDYAAGNIKGIALICDTPGGMVAGCFDTAEKMVALKNEVGVPVRGFAHEAAYSAGYMIISTADHIVVSRTGGVGSIGVVTSHIDASGAYERMGLKITFIFAGKHKVDGNSAAPLPDDVKDRIQARIDELYDVFVSCVARNRAMDEQAVRDTEALTFTANQAVSHGLADSIGSLDDAVAAFAADMSSTSGDEEMSTQDNTAAVDRAAHDTAVAAARAEGHAAGKAEGLTEGAAAAQTRIAGILGSEEAKGRTAQAEHLAFKTSMSVEDAVGVLASGPKAEPAAAAPAATVEDNFDDAMRATAPDLGGNGAEADAASGGKSDVLASLKSMGVIA